MPSPFPGMDPYLEAPDIWPDFHEAFAGEVRAALNQTLPAPYYARLEMRPEVGIVEDGGYQRRIVPDVAVVQPTQPRAGEGGVAVLEASRTMISPSFEVRVASEPIRHPFVEIRDPSRGHRLVTLIEIASPSNKHAGPDRQAYLRKQAEVRGSDASLIELDLLRTGERLITDPSARAAVEGFTPAPDYLALVDRSWTRAEAPWVCQVFPVQLTGMLPVIPVPLRQGQDEVPLDLQHAFNRAYDGGPYRRGAVDYGASPQPPLSAEGAAWAAQRLRDHGMIGQAPG
jgi:hypothetical protein